MWSASTEQIYAHPHKKHTPLFTSNSNYRLKSAVNMPICVLKRGDLCVKMRPDACIKTR